MANAVDITKDSSAATYTSLAIPELAAPLSDPICQKCDEEKERCLGVRELAFFLTSLFSLSIFPFTSAPACWG